MMNKSKSGVVKIIFTAICLIAFAACVAYASVYDLAISEKWADPDWLMGNILEIAGEPPSLIFAAFNLTVILGYLKKSGNKNKRTLLALSYAGLTVACFYPVFITCNYLGCRTAVSVTVGITGTVILMGVFKAIERKLNDDFLKKYIRTASVCIGIALTVLIVITGLKMFWGRVRYIQLNDALAKGLYFTPWYLPQGITGYRSFPSGHTANASVIFLVSLYFPKHRKWLCPLLILWIVILAASRVLVGAHYFSDVLFGGAVTGLIIFIWCRKTGVWKRALN